MSKPSITVHRTIEFSETDAAGLVHFSNYFRFMETAERAFFERAGLPLFQSDGTAVHGFPRVDAACRYLRPLRFGDVIAITLTLERIRSCSLHFSVRFARLAEEDATEPVAEGSFTTVLSTLDASAGAMRARTLPEEWLARMGWETRAPEAPQIPASPD